VKQKLCEFVGRNCGNCTIVNWNALG